MRAQELGSGKLVIFDIDDILVNTDTRVNVVRDGEIIKQLNSHDFTHYKLQSGMSKIKTGKQMIRMICFTR